MALVLMAGACTQPVSGAALGADPAGSAVETTPAEPSEPPSASDEFPSEPTRPTTTTITTTTTRTSSSQVTIAKRKTVTTPPACATLVTTAQIGQLTGTTATAEPEDKGFCSYTLARSGRPAGITLVVLTQQFEAGDSQETVFEGNTAHRLSTQPTSCDLRVALTDDQTSDYRVLWVSMVLASPGEPLCQTAEKLAKAVFDKLPDT
jgi:hypothetical protein